MAEVYRLASLVSGIRNGIAVLRLRVFGFLDVSTSRIRSLFDFVHSQDHFTSTTKERLHRIRGKNTGEKNLSITLLSKQQRLNECSCKFYILWN